MDTTKQPKRGYERPVLQFEGTVKDLTLGSSTGSYTDKTFPVSTPKKSLTFSST